ncbi:MAG: hypothetical protein K2O69_00850, partial [Odoribacter sp.]|nr:hypothetical protein [Odoribacter sp.]
ILPNAPPFEDTLYRETSLPAHSHVFTCSSTYHHLNKVLTKCKQSAYKVLRKAFCCRFIWILHMFCYIFVMAVKSGCLMIIDTKLE